MCLRVVFSCLAIDYSNRGMSKQYPLTAFLESPSRGYATYGEVRGYGGTGFLAKELVQECARTTLSFGLFPFWSSRILN